MAVYTPLDHAEIARFLGHYGVGTLVLAAGIEEGIENTNYLLETNDGSRSARYILTIFEKRVAAADLPFCLGLTEWLSDRGIRCPRPVKGYDRGMIYTIKGKPAALVSFLEGTNRHEITPEHLAQLGEMIARMHLAAEGFPMTRRNGMGMETWRSLFIGACNRLDEIIPELEALMGEELAWLEKRWPEALPAGPVHADLFPDNVFFKTGRDGELKISGVIDFYFACDDFWAYDLLIAMNAWCFDGAYSFVPERARALLSAYQELRPLTWAEKEAMPVLARGAAMRFLATRAHDWLNRVEGALVVPKDPMEYVAKLKFHQNNNFLPVLGGG